MQTSFKTIKKENIFKAALILVTFLFLTASGILFKQSFLRMIPLYISLIVGLLQSNVNRYAPLIGGINSIIYAAVFLYYHLYASSALFMSCPLQLITFVLWNKKPWGNSTVLKKLSAGKRAVLIAGSVLAWILICFFLSETDSSFRELDTAVTVLGTVSTVLTMLSYYDGNNAFGRCRFNFIVCRHVERDAGAGNLSRLLDLFFYMHLYGVCQGT